MEQRETIIRNYIAAYNHFDIDGMMADFDEHIHFENISAGESSLRLTGLAAFRDQAEQAKQFFSSRQQTIQSFKHTGDETLVEIDFQAVLANDLPNGMKKGDRMHFPGQSVFTFAGNKITGITDIS